MVINTFFNQDGLFQIGEVEVRLMPGIPQVHVVGMPDAHIRELGMKLKAAVKHCELSWPRGQQVVVNLRPSYFRKSSSGADLAIALGFLAATGQLTKAFKEKLKNTVVHGEITLDGVICAPERFGMAVAAANAAGFQMLTGPVEEFVREGEWMEVSKLSSLDEVVYQRREFDWEKFWRRPELPKIELHESAAKALWLTAHAGLSVLIAGPQGSGKTTWAEALHALSPRPVKEQVQEVVALFGDSVLDEHWRPFERPHHTIPALSMIGGGVPLQAGVISRAHGGTLVMDEFLEFDSRVLESLREPIETGYIEHVRRAEKVKFPAKFQLVATTNLCPCGKLNPGMERSCSYNLIRCRSVCGRLSGPVMDRFEWMVFSHEWSEKGEKVSMEWVKETVERLRRFAEKRGPQPLAQVPEWYSQIQTSFRRRRAMSKVARALADFDESIEIQSQHFHLAEQLVTTPMEKLRQLFA